MFSVKIGAYLWDPTHMNLRLGYIKLSLLQEIRLTRGGSFNLVDVVEWKVHVEWNSYTQWELHSFHLRLDTCDVGKTDYNWFCADVI